MLETSSPMYARAPTKTRPRMIICEVRMDSSGAGWDGVETGAARVLACRRYSSAIRI